ncbi:GCN5-like N-acetyltransferase [gamma proteobacterium IMCC1989]|nr:GCN5-like N-acetyltransferase [gamma proteobacterium IMCC1989]
MVIDDLANRSYDCDLLLDQTFGRSSKDYEDLIPNESQLLLGAKYALLRNEFSQHRIYSLERRAKPKLKRLLITLGGVDKDNITSTILDSISNENVSNQYELTIILGKTSPWIQAVKEQANALFEQCEVLVNPTNIAEIMANSDLCIGAAGSTTWERCCLGLPTIQIVSANNQRLIADTLNSLQAISLLVEPTNVCTLIKKSQNILLKRTLASSTLCDGKGVQRTISAIYEKQITQEIEIVPISKQDSHFLFSLQSADNRQYFRNPETPSQQEHDSWFNTKLTDSNSITYIIKDIENLGFIRIDDIHDKKEISIIISNEQQGRGIASQALRAVDKLLPASILSASIHVENLASQMLFIKSGFKKATSKSQFLTYNKKVEHYIVAAIGDWNKALYIEKHSTLPGIWHFCSTPEELNNLLNHIKPRYIFFPHWRWIVPQRIFNNIACVCFHMTDLPYGRGGSPLQNLISRGHKNTQLSALQMQKDLDSGPIYMKRPLDLSGKASEIYHRAAQLSWEIISELVINNIKPEAQEGTPTHFTRRTPKQSILPTQGDASQLYDHIRMLDADGYPAAFINYGEFRIELTDASLNEHNALSAKIQIRRNDQC